MQRSLSVTIGAAAVGLALAGASHASVIAYEDFNYTAGQNLVGQNGGYQWTSAWSTVTGITSPVVGSGDMTWDKTSTGGIKLSTSGNKIGPAGAGATGNSRAAVRALPSNWTPTNGSVLWIAFRANQSQNAFPSNNAGFALEATTTGLNTTAGDVELFLGNRGSSSTNYGFNYNKNGGSSFTGNASGSLTGVSKDALLIYKVDYQSTTATVVSMWVNPTTTSEGSLGTAAATATVTDSTMSQATFRTIKYNTGNSSDGWTHDELRLGTSYADVITVPEPAGVALAAIGAVGFLSRRKRRQATLVR